MGLCIPNACNENDVRLLLNMSLSENHNKNKTAVEILEVRTPHHPYLFWEDSVFWVLA